MGLLKRKQQNRDESRQGQMVKHQKNQSPMARLRSEIDRVFDRVWKDFGRDPWSALTELPTRFGSLGNWPAMDVVEDEKSYTIRMDVPGLEAKDLDVEISGSQLTVRGERHDEFTEEEKGMHRRERYSGSFARSVTLPSYVDASKIEARYDKGTLTLSVPRIPGQGPKRVQVKTQ